MKSKLHELKQRTQLALSVLKSSGVSEKAIEGTFILAVFPVIEAAFDP